jgi:hypothetical protein
LEQRPTEEAGDLVANRVLTQHATHDALKDVPLHEADTPVKTGPSALDVAIRKDVRLVGVKAGKSRHVMNLSFTSSQGARSALNQI